MPSYLDDPDHSWEIDPIAGNRTMGQLIKELADRAPEEETLQIIFKGYWGLKYRHSNVTDAACLDTSMVWMWG